MLLRLWKLDAEVELTQARSRGLNASATNARQALADRLRTELKQAKRQSQRSAQAAADAAQAVRDFERYVLLPRLDSFFDDSTLTRHLIDSCVRFNRTYLSHGNDDNHRMRTATRQRASSNFVAALLSPPNEGAPVHSEAASVHHAESSVADLASGHNTWSSGVRALYAIHLWLQCLPNAPTPCEAL